MSKGNGNQTRDRGGRFSKGNCGGPGRTPGSHNQTTYDLRTIRREICESWFEGGAKAKLLELLEKRPADYFALVARIMPREVKAEISSPTNSIGVQITPAGRLFQQRCAECANENNGVVTAADLRRIRDSLPIGDEDLGIGVTGNGSPES